MAFYDCRIQSCQFQFCLRLLKRLPSFRPLVPTFLINFNKMSTFNDQFLLASLNHEQYMAQQQLAIQLAQAKAAEMDNSTTAAIKTPFDPAAYDLVQESI